MSSVCCDIEKTECVFRECKECKNIDYFCDDPDKMISYEFWCSRTDERKGDKNKTYVVKLTEKKKVECSLGTLVSEFKACIPKFFIHQFRTWHQFSTLNLTRKNIKKNEVYLVSTFLKMTKVSMEDKFTQRILGLLRSKFHSWQAASTIWLIQIIFAFLRSR